MPLAERARAYALALAAAAALLLTAFTPARAQTAGGSSKPTPIPNSRRYSDKGQKPATGRSGSASLTVRALLGKDGRTAVEMTTGALDSRDTPPGNISKAQLKPLDADGDALFAQNYNGLPGGGYFATTVSYLHRAQQLQVQTNIDGIDRRRTNVVTVVETVKKRPDLAASDLAPAQALVGTPVVISATARELNGDVGAAADAVLYVDGSEVDRARGIFVDAGGAVTVAFTYVFADAGTKQVEVRLEGVTPGDYDTSNNSVAGQIVVIQPQDNLNYDASLTDEEVSSTESFSHKDGFEDPLTGYRTEYGNDTTNTSATQSVSLDAYTRVFSSFPYQFSAAESSGAAQFSTALNVGADSSFTFDFGAFHFDVVSGSAADLTENVRVFVSTVRLTSGGAQLYGETDVQYARFAGSVTYHSQGYSRYWYMVNGVRFDVDDYTFNSDDTHATGTRLAVGPQYAITVALTSSDTPAQVFTASPVMDVQGVASSSVTPQACSSWTFPDPPPPSGFFFGSDCEQSSASYVRKTGSAFFSGAP